jgi:SAM-dependent methyltransferase
MQRVPTLRRDLLRAVHRRVGNVVRRFFPTELDNLEWNRKMAEGYVRTRGRGTGDVPLGQEWGAPAVAVDAILDEFVFPFVSTDSVALEVGIGGGRIAARVAPRVSRLYGFDISPAMLVAARTALAQNHNVELRLLDGPALSDELEGEVDLAYAFATFLHLDLHMMWRYFREFARVLHPGGHAFVHTATITTPDGWARFAGQERYAVAGFYFVSPEIVRTLGSRAGLTLVRESSEDPDNPYLNRDHFALFRK